MVQRVSQQQVLRFSMLVIAQAIAVIGGRISRQSKFEAHISGLWRADVAESPTIIDLISNGTMSAEMAATMWAFAVERRSFISAAVPRLAGKTAIADAVMDMVALDVPVHELSGDVAEMEAFRRQRTGGYLRISEISRGPFQNYVWGETARRLFDAVSAGYALVATMHADGLDDVFQQICVDNEVSDDAASQIGFVIYIRRLGDETNGFWRRVAELHEIDGVEGGRSRGRVLHRWIEDEDRFEMLEWPATLGYGHEEMATRAAALRDRAESGRRSASDVAEMVAGFAR